MFRTSNSWFDADLSDFIPGIGFGISVYEICQESCGIVEMILKDVWI